MDKVVSWIFEHEIKGAGHRFDGNKGNGRKKDEKVVVAHDKGGMRERRGAGGEGETGWNEG